MTGLTKNSQNEEYEDNTSGPRIRHPSGTPYPKFIFLREKNDKTKLSSAARLYQDIIHYSISSEYDKLQQDEHRQGFKITDIGDWLLDNNQDYFNYYKDSDAKVRDRKKKENVYNRIKRYLANLEKWDLILGLEKVEPDTRNGQKTWLYGYTELGYIIAWCLEWLYKLHQQQRAKKIIFDLIRSMLKSLDSYGADFLADFYERVMQYDKNKQHGLFDNLIWWIVFALNSPYSESQDVIKYINAAERMFLKGEDAPIVILPDGSATNPKIKKILLKLYLEAFNDRPEEIRKILLYNHKFFYESQMLKSHPPKAWYKDWLVNINNCNTIVLCGKCQNKECSANVIFVDDTYNHIRNTGLLGKDYSEIDCFECKMKKSVHVYTSMNDFGK